MAAMMIFKTCESRVSDAQALVTMTAPDGEYVIGVYRGRDPMANAAMGRDHIERNWSDCPCKFCNRARKLAIRY